jgi:hypothetical protein
MKREAIDEATTAKRTAARERAKQYRQEKKSMAIAKAYLGNAPEKVPPKKAPSTRRECDSEIESLLFYNRLPIPDVGCGVYFLTHENHVVFVSSSLHVSMKLIVKHRRKLFDDFWYVRVRSGERVDVEKAFIYLLVPRCNNPIFDMDADAARGLVTEVLERKLGHP